MPIKQAAIKALRQTKKRTARRATVLKNVKMTLASLKKMVISKSRKDAQELTLKLQKVLDKAAKTRVISVNKAARLKSKWMKLLKTNFGN